MILVDNQLPAVIAKIERVLGAKPECFITHPSELRVLTALSDADLRESAHEHGWRVVRRVGGRQIEFYNDATVSFRPL
jgi:hypothetical protein